MLPAIKERGEFVRVGICQLVEKYRQDHARVKSKPTAEKALTIIPSKKLRRYNQSSAPMRVLYGSAMTHTHTERYAATRSLSRAAYGHHAATKNEISASFNLARIFDDKERLDDVLSPYTFALGAHTPINPFIHIFPQDIDILTHDFRPIFKNSMHITDMNMLSQKRLL